MSTDKSDLLEAANASSKLSICHTCYNYYTDDCGYCCKHEGDEFMPADDWENDAVTECKYYEEDNTEEINFVQPKKVVGEMVSMSVIKQIQEQCERELDYYDHGMVSLDAYRFAKCILDIIEKNMVNMEG